MAAALWRAGAGGAARHSVGGAPDRSRRRPLAAAHYNARRAVANLSEHEPVPSRDDGIGRLLAKPSR